MKAIYAEEPYRIGYREVDIPECGDDDVLIKTAYLGVCASDLHAYRGQHAFRIPPVMLGHELSGVIEKTGKNVKGWKAGDRVSVMPQIGCGKCSACRAGKTNLCAEKILPGTEKWNGTFAEYFVAPASVLIDLGNVPLKLGAIVEPLAVAVHAIERFPADHSENLLILGSGAIALMILSIAKSYGFKRIMTTDIDDRNLDLAKKIGANVVVNPNKADIKTAAGSFFGNDAVLNIVIGAGADTILEQAINIATPGSNIVYYAMITKNMTLNTYPIVFKELNLRGSLNYTYRDFEGAVRLLEEHGEAFNSIITNEFKFEEAQEAFEMQDKKEKFIIKSVIRV